MSIKYYKNLISTLPVRQQSFTTKRATWRKEEEQFYWFKTLNQHMFQDNKTLTISRQDIFNTSDFRKVLIKTIYWGYPGGMRGNNVGNILKSIQSIEETYNELIQTKNPKEESFKKFTKKIKGDSITGLGLSTYTKLLHFSSITFDNNPCLILDQRLINVFTNKVFTEFHDFK